MRYNETVGSPETFKKDPGPNDPASLEQRIEHRLDTLPPDLRRSWSQRLEQSSDADLPVLEEELGTFLAKREKALFGKVPDLFKGMSHLERNQDAIEKTLGTIRDAEGRPELYIGEGKTAHVYRDPNTRGLCYKFVNNFQEYEAWNSVEREARFLEMLENLHVEDVRVPRLSSVIDLPDTKVIAMEYLDAVSIAGVLERGRALPEGFDLKIYFKKLRAFVSAMHQKNVYHRDLHEGNVLVGKDGNPFVIDFGRAVYAPIGDFAYEAYDRTNTNHVVLPSDESWIDGLEIKLGNHLNSLQKVA